MSTTSSLSEWVARVTGAAEARPAGRIQSLWSGYGELLRFRLVDGSAPTVVVKDVCPPTAGGTRSHARKLRSYAVETRWYEHWSGRCGVTCRVPAVLAAERIGDRFRIALEDLDATGFSVRIRQMTDAQTASCLGWLAAFHGRFMGATPTGLWPVGTYWHLDTRPDELAAMGNVPLQAAATAIDARLSAARHQTLVHGDAKPANFCFARRGRGVAAVDFQYVGGGCGMKDVAYLLSHEASRPRLERWLDLYFRQLRAALKGAGSSDAIEREWRDLIPFAWADYHRFLDGWAPGWRVHRLGRQITRDVLRSL